MKNYRKDELFSMITTDDTEFTEEKRMAFSVFSVPSVVLSFCF